MVEKGIIITAGGVGKRMGAAIPKQFLLLNEKPILLHTIQRFYDFDKNMKIVLVLPANQIEFWKEMCTKFEFVIPHKIVEGGKERFHSVKNGLANLEAEIIGVHDAVRPLVSVSVIADCFNTAEKSGAAIPVIGVTQSLRQIKHKSSIAVNRSEFKLVQTPQCFNGKILKEAYKRPFKDGFTDDASVVEAIGHKIELIKGNEENIKITTPFDLKMAESLL